MKTKVDAEWIGRLLAECDDQTQADIINEFGRVLFIICGNEQQSLNQVSYISDKLNHSGIRVIKQIAEMIQTIEREKKS